MCRQKIHIVAGVAFHGFRRQRLHQFRKSLLRPISVSAPIEIDQRRLVRAVKEVRHQHRVSFFSKPPRHRSLRRADAADVGQMDYARPPGSVLVAVKDSACCSIVGTDFNIFCDHFGPWAPPACGLGCDTREGSITWCEVSSKLEAHYATQVRGLQTCESELSN